MDKDKFDSVVNQLGSIKQEVAELVMSSPNKTPSIAGTAHNFMLYLDTAYLWFTQVAQAMAQASDENVEALVDQAVSSGNVVQFPGTTNGKA